MADFDVPFGQDSERRFPTSTERENGFPCGAADQSLFNGLIWQLQAELGAIHDEAGIAGDDSTSSTTVDAILALIAAATGGNPAGYVLMTQARARLPVYPEVLNTDGRIVVTAPSTGTVRLPGGVDFLHRGIFSVTTAQTDFLTDPSKTYHLRWDQVNGFRLIDTASGTYNPTALVETNAAFDSTYDDMLIARVITNSSNVATITNLANKARLRLMVEKTTVEVTAAPTGAVSYTCNFARTPRAYLSETDVSPASDPNAEHIIGFTRTVNRYGGTARTLGFVPNNPPGSNYVNGTFKLELDA